MKKIIVLSISVLFTTPAHSGDSDKMVQQHMYDAQSKGEASKPTPTPSIKMHKKTTPYSDIKMHKKIRLKWVSLEAQYLSDILNSGDIYVPRTGHALRFATRGEGCSLYVPL